MEEKKECKIIQDLLPNYIENLTNEESNQFIKNHISNCKECKQIYMNMRNELELNTEKTDKKEIKFLKKYRNKLRKLKIIILIILVIFVINIGRKVIIISGLSHNAEKYSNYTNYHYIEYSYGRENYTKVEVYKLDNKMKMIMSNITENRKEVITMFGRDMIMEEKEFDRYLTNIYVENGNTKSAFVNQDFGISGKLKNILYVNNNWDLIRYSIFASITPKTFNGNTSYYITNFKGSYMYCPEGMYIDREKGLPLNTIAYEYENDDGSKMRSNTREYIYEFNTVTDKDFIEPNIDEYEIKSKIDFN